MVQFITHRITCLVMLVVWCASISTLHADWLDDALNDLKAAAHAVDDAFTTAGHEIEKGANTAINALKDHFTSTKLTRSVDYEIRKKAMQAALWSANLVLNGTQQASTGILTISEEAAKTALSAAEGFLDVVVKNASTGILEGGAAAAQGVLEGVKQGSIATLQGTQWVVSNVAGQFDITRIAYAGDLKSLEHGVFGNVACEGKLLTQPFSFNFDLDPRSLASVGKSIEGLVTKCGDTLKEKIINPIEEKFKPLRELAEKFDHATKHDAKPIQQQVAKAVEAAQASADASEKLAQQQKLTAKPLIDATTQVQEIARKTNDELKALIAQGRAEGSAASTLSRAEFIRRQKEAQGKK